MPIPPILVYIPTSDGFWTINILQSGNPEGGSLRRIGEGEFCYGELEKVRATFEAEGKVTQVVERDGKLCVVVTEHSDSPADVTPRAKSGCVGILPILIAIVAGGAWLIGHIS